MQIRVRDILGRHADEQSQELPGTLVVAPRTVPVRRSDRSASPIGERRATSSLHTDPSLYGGVRPFQAGDSLRRVHWRATARLGMPVSRRYEPARGREVMLAVDVQTLPGPHWQMTWDEPSFESLCIAAASLTRELLDAGASVGLAAASFAGSPQRFAWLPPRASLSQLPRAGQLLARIGPVSSAPLSALLSWLPHRVTPGSGIVLLTSRDPSENLTGAPPAGPDRLPGRADGHRLGGRGPRQDRAAGRAAGLIRTGTATLGGPECVRRGRLGSCCRRPRHWPRGAGWPSCTRRCRPPPANSRGSAPWSSASWPGPAWPGGVAGAGAPPPRRRSGLPLLALAAGAFCWLLDPLVRGDLAVGQPIAALSLHGPAWLGALAFWRGEVHRSVEDDDVIQDRLLRWVLPGLAIPWLVGHAASTGAIEEAFTSAAFVGTVFFIGSAFTAMGLSRLEAVRVVTGSDWRSNRSWVVLVVGIAIAMTLLAAPAAAFLGVPAQALLAAVVGPIQTLLFVLVLLFTPVILLGALLADLIQPLLPEGFGLGQITPPTTLFNARDAASNLPSVLFYIILGALLVFELFVLGVMVWMRHQEKRRMRPWPARHSRSARSSSRPPPATGRRQPPPRDAALHYRSTIPPARIWRRSARSSAMGRWARLPNETPAAHAGRIRSDGMAAGAFARLAAAYQLVRYGALPLSDRERRRSTPRLRALRSWLDRS